MSAIPQKGMRDSTAVRLLRELEAAGLVSVSQVGKAWRIRGHGIDLLIASLSWLHTTDLGAHRLPGKVIAP